MKHCLSKTDNNGNILGELTFGTNSRTDLKAINSIGAVEVLRNTVHFGFGLNKHLGGQIQSNVHWDAVINYNQTKLFH